MQAGRNYIKKFVIFMCLQKMDVNRFLVGKNLRKKTHWKT